MTFFPRIRSRRAALGALSAVCLSTGLSAHALERVHLTTGFSYDCTRSEPVDASHLKLYLYTPDKPDTATTPDNYIVVSTGSVASVETVPDPPATLPALQPPHNSPPPDVNELLARAGAQHNIDIELLASIVHTESDGRSHAVSRAGARGLMQLMPSTADGLGVKDAFDPGQNIAGGSAYLDSLLTRYGNNLALALAAYNAGPAAVDRYRGIPPFHETRAYVARVMAEFKRRKLALQHSTASLAATAVH